jgi:hypothetical protein
MIEAPLILRASLWPVELIRGLESPDFARDLDHWLAAGAGLHAEGKNLADQLHPIVPQLANRKARAGILALRRALHRGIEPVEIPAIAALPAIDPALQEALEVHASKRATHRQQRAELEAAYHAAIERERAEVRLIAADPRFQKALALASPAAFRDLVRDPGLNSSRLVRTILQFALRAAGRATPNGLWAGTAIETGVCEEGIETQPAPALVRFQPKLACFAGLVELPPAYRDAWQALGEAGLAPELLDDLAQLCRSLADELESLSPTRFAGLLDCARGMVNNLRARFGARPVPDDESVLLADSTAPVRFRVSPSIKGQIESAVRTAWAFDRMGIGEQDARSRRTAEFTSAEPPPVSFDPWTGELAPVFANRTHRLPHPPPADSIPLGSCLLRLELAGASAAIRLGSITPDPALFYGRFDHLLRPVSDAFYTWYRDSQSYIENNHAPVRFADLAIRRASDLNAAARPRFTEQLLDPVSAASAHIARGPGGLPRLGIGDSPCVVPLLSTAVSLHTADECTRKLAALAHLIGRPALMCPLPVLLRERDEWHHLPRLELDANVVIGAERWILPPEARNRFASTTGFERFAAWRQYAMSAGLPSLVYVFTGLETTESLLPAAGTLAVETLGRAAAEHDAALRFQEAFPGPRGSWLQDEQGCHYLAELAAAWPGDAGFWTSYTDGLEKDNALQ